MWLARQTEGSLCWHQWHCLHRHRQTDSSREEGWRECLDPAPSWPSKSLDTIFVPGYSFSYTAHQFPSTNASREWTLLLRHISDAVLKQCGKDKLYFSLAKCKTHQLQSETQQKNYTCLNFQRNVKKMRNRFWLSIFSALKFFNIFFLIHYLISSNTVYFLAAFHKLSGSNRGIFFNVINIVVNQKEADVYSQNVPYTF